MPTWPTLGEFIDDELLRVPMTIDLVIDAVHQRWRERMPHQGRGDLDPARALQRHRAALSAKALAVLQSSAHDELRLLQPGGVPPARPAHLSDVSRPAGQISGAPSLALIDEDDVAVDIEIARCIHAVKLQAETVLREMHTYTSALVNDPNVARDTNPFRPEHFVRALWAGVETLPIPRPLMVAFLHDAADPLAVTLKRAYTAACRRLEDQGVQPASYRTIVVTGPSAWGATAARMQLFDDLPSLRSGVSAAAPARTVPVAVVVPVSVAARGAAPTNGQPPTVQGNSPAPDARQIELLARLFDAIQRDFDLPADTVALMQRLQPTALRMALRDPSLLDRYDHAVWRFMDQLAHDIELCAAPDRGRLVGLGRNLVDHLADNDGRDSHGFAWALERLLAAQRHGLNQAIAAAQPAIAKLQRIADDEASVATGAMPLDIGNMDTVPAALMPEQAAPAAAPAGLGLPPGSLLRMYLQGKQRTVISLWQDRQHELALLREPATGQLFALRQRAVARLQDEGLATPYKVRSLVRRSAEKVLRGR